MERARYSKYSYFLLFLILIVYFISAIGLWPFTVDDAYISARYAQNAVLGRGLTFNPGDRVMGYTNLLLVLLEALFYRLGFDGILGAKLVGLLAGGGVLWLTVELGKLLNPQGKATGGLVAAALLALYPFLPLSSVMGLESSLFTFLLLASVTLFVFYWQRNTWTGWQQFAIAILLMLATLTRPEGAGFAVVLAACQVLHALYIARRSLNWRTVWKADIFHTLIWFAEYVSLLLPVLLILTAYYGSPIPNTFFAKTSARLFLLKKVITGLAYFSYFFSQSGFYLLIPLLFLQFFMGQLTSGTGIVMAVASFFTVYVLYAGGDWMPGFRFLLPVLPYYFVIAGNNLSKIWDVLSGSFFHVSILSRRLIAYIVLFSLIAPSFSGYFSLREHVMERAEGYQEAHRFIGTWLRANTTSETVVALMDVGMIGFFSDCHILDFAGLVNRQVANFMYQDGGSLSSSYETATDVANFVLRQRPEYIILAHTTPDRLVGWIHDQAISESLIFQNEYVYLFTRTHTSDYFLSVYKLADTQ